MEKRQEYTRSTVRARAICGLSNLLLAEYQKRLVIRGALGGLVEGS